MKILDYFRKKKEEPKIVYSNDYAELSIGIVKFKVITNGILNDVTTRSTIFGSTLNNNLFYQFMEYSIVDLPKEKIDELTTYDGTKLREKLKEVLIRYGIVKKEEPKIEPKIESNDDADIFSKNDIAMFEKQKMDAIQRVIAQGVAKNGR